MGTVKFTDHELMPSMYVSFADGTIVLFLWGMQSTYVDGNPSDAVRTKLAKLIDKRASNGLPLPLWLARVRKIAEKSKTLPDFVTRLEGIAS